jgi:hypothetical protein
MRNNPRAESSGELAAAGQGNGIVERPLPILQRFHQLAAARGAAIFLTRPVPLSGLGSLGAFWGGS